LHDLDPAGPNAVRHSEAQVGVMGNEAADLARADDVTKPGEVHIAFAEMRS
jgi:hypothetical protein